MWISRKMWTGLEKRVADLEEQVQSQPEKIIKAISDNLEHQMTKSVSRHHRNGKNQSCEQA